MSRYLPAEPENPIRGAQGKDRKGRAKGKIDFRLQAAVIGHVRTANERTRNELSAFDACLMLCYNL